MAETRTFTFKIPEAKPEQIPAVRLAAYIKDLAVLFGDEDFHVVAIDSNSTDLAILLDPDREAVARERLSLAGTPNSPIDIAEAMHNIDGRLKKDGQSAEIIDERDNKKAKLLYFPGFRAS